MTDTVKLRRKLIEVALPLEAINAACVREKSIRHGHPSTLHLWWARRPLAAARAVIFSQMVDDPSSHPEEFPTEEDQDRERQRLFRLIEQMVLWENITNETVLQQARDEIRKSWRSTCADNKDHPQAAELFNPEKLPAFHDPFCGGGALPLEAQRLGLEAYASDLNPVAVLITKAMIEIPPKFAGRPPVNSEARQQKSLMQKEWRGAMGLAEDVRYYGKWMRDEAEKRIGHLYPEVEVTNEIVKERPDLKQYVGRKLTVIAWLWARTVKSPNPAFSHVDVPLATTFMLSTKAGKEAYVEPVIENGGYRFTVKVGKPRDAECAKNGTKVGRGGNFRCLMSGTPIPVTAIREQGLAGTLDARLMAIVAEGDSGRVYLTPTPEHETAAKAAIPAWTPDLEINHNPRDIRTQLYGMKTYGDLFTPRQLVALTTFSDLVQEARERVKQDAVATGMPDDGLGLDEGGVGATAYADAVAVYLGLATSRASDAWSIVVSWRNGVEATRGTFSRQALAMVWDFAEASPFSGSCGNWKGACLEWISKAIDAVPAAVHSQSSQSDAASQSIGVDMVVSTDPPYYDNIAYADLSDFFYVWLRRSLQSVYPTLFATLAVPKAEELVATPYRHGSKEEAEKFFLEGMTRAMRNLSQHALDAFPVSIYYAFKQSENGKLGASSTGWDTFLSAVIEAGFAISGTWPMRTEKPGRVISNDANALASSIVLICRPQDSVARTITRREFLATLTAELPEALSHLQASNIAPVDLQQAAIGPGMAIYTRYSRVLNASGEPLSVRDALALINQTLDEVLAKQEGDFDSDSRWALAWFEQSGFAEGEYGVAETLSTAKVTSVAGMAQAGILVSGRGKVRLLRPEELPEDWDPTTDTRTPAWESVHHLVRTLDKGGDRSAGALMSKLGAGRSEVARELAYRLYTICERKGWAKEALSYNSLVQSWPEISSLATVNQQAEQGALL